MFEASPAYAGQASSEAHSVFPALSIVEWVGHFFIATKKYNVICGVVTRHENTIDKN